MPRAAKTILSTRTDAELRKQLIWQPPPVVRLQQEIPAPNMVQYSLPVLPPPPPKPAPKAFLPRPEEPRVAPQNPPIAMLPAPQIAEPKLNPPATSSSVMPTLPKPAARRFVPPSAQTRSTQPVEAVPAVEAPPSLIADSLDNKALNALIVGLEPADRLRTPLPPGSLPAQVSASLDEEVGRSAGSSGNRGLIVPNVVVREGKEAASPFRSVPRATFEERARAATRATISAPLRASSRVLPATVEANFRDRTLYTCLLEMPTLSEELGNSVLWFAERDVKDGSALLMRAPVLVRAETPAPPTNLPASQNKVYLRLWIGREGFVKSVILIQSSGDPFSDAILKALAQWEFVPATKNGQPVDVDAIVELPFRSVVRASGK